MVLPPEGGPKERRVGVEHLQPGRPVPGQGVLPADDVQRRPPLRPGLSENQRAVGEVERGQPDLAGRFGPRRLPVHPAALFLGFANDDTQQYLWLQREECSQDEVRPYAGNVWVERDDQMTGGHGGITRVVLTCDTFSVRLTPERAEQMGGYDEYRVRL